MLRQNNNVEKPDLSTTIELQEPVALTFSLKYLVNFCKASGLSGSVTLSLSNEIPLLIECVPILPWTPGSPDTDGFPPQI